MPKLIAVIVAMATASLCASCTAVTGGTTEQFQIVSDPPGAEARTSMGLVCTTPCTLQVGRKDEFTVTISKAGYQPAQIPVSTKVNTGGGPAFADALTGAGPDHHPNPVEADLVPLKPTRARPRKPSPQAKEVPPLYRRWEGDDRA